MELDRRDEIARWVDEHIELSDQRIHAIMHKIADAALKGAFMEPDDKPRRPWGEDND